MSLPRLDLMRRMALLPLSSLLTIFISIAIASAAYEDLEKPILLWTQRSHVWSKFRGLPGSPSKWLDQQLKPYIQSESSRETHRYALGFHSLSKHVYWSDRKSYSIHKQPISESIGAKSMDRITTIYTDRDSEIHAIAVDWLTGNVYFTEARNKWIAVVADNGGASSQANNPNNFRILFSSNLGAPRGIAVDPKKGLLFWSDSPGANNSQAKLERSTTDGRDRRVLVDTDMERPLGVALDTTEERVYWVDRNLGRVESVKYDGSDRRKVVQGGGDMTFLGLALFMDYIFVTTEANLKVSVYSKADGRVLKEIDIDATPYQPIVIEEPKETPKHDCEGKSCSDLCLNTGENKGDCECRQGYYLQMDGTSCGQSRPMYIYSVGSEVRSADITIKDKSPHVLSVNQKAIVSGTKQVQALGFHYNQNLLYYSDTELKTISKASATGQNNKEHTVQTSRVEGVAVDWTSDQVFWSDAMFEHIMTSRLSGRFHRLLVEQTPSPKGIAVDPVNKFLFWVSGKQDTGVIKKSLLDGSDMTTLVTLGKDSAPQGLVADPRMKRVYWVDKRGERIECVTMEGEERRVVTEAPAYGLYDVTIFQDYTTWTEGDKGLQFGLVRSGEKLPGVWSNDQNPIEESFDVITFDVYLQPQSSNDCTRNNGGCAQLCYPVSNGARCGCGIGFTLDPDGRTCNSTVVKGNFAFFVDPYHKQIYQVTHSGDMGNVQGVPLHTPEHPVSMDYDSAGEKFYWIDTDKAAIMRGGISGEKTQSLRAFDRDSRPEKLALDPILRHLYYSDSLKRAIYKMDLSGANHQKVISDIPAATAFTVDYIGGMLYWFNVDKLEASALDGSERETLVENLQNVSCISVYYHDQMMYFTDPVRGQLRAYNLTTGEEQILIPTSAPARQFHTVAASQKFLYYSAWNEKAVYRVDRLTGEGETRVYQPVFARITDLRAIDDRLPFVGEESDPMFIIIIGAIAGALFFLILLLAIIFGARRGCKKRKADSGDGNYEQPDLGDNSFDPPAGNTLNPPVDNSFDPPTRAGNGNLANGNGYLTVPNGHAGNGHAQNGYLSNGNGMQNGGLHSSAYSSNGMEGYPNSGYETYPGDYHSTENGMTVIPPPPVTTAPLPPPIKPVKLRKNTQPPPPPPKKPNNFQLETAGAQATMIQRLANRLRKGISSIRWSRGDGGGDGDYGGHPDKAHKGNAKDRAAHRKKHSSRLDALITAGNTGGDNYVEPAKPVEREPTSKMDIPPNTHKMPRGFAPASHCVPVVVRTTWNKPKVPEITEQAKTEKDKV